MPEENQEQQQVAQETPEQTNQEQPMQNNSDDAPGFGIKTFLPIAIGLFFVILLFVKLVIPALLPNVDHSATGILEPTKERDYESFFGK